MNAKMRAETARKEARKTLRADDQADGAEGDSAV